MAARIGKEHIKKLQELLKEQTGKDYTNEEAQGAGLAIMRFVALKELRKVSSEPILKNKIN